MALGAFTLRKIVILKLAVCMNFADGWPTWECMCVCVHVCVHVCVRLCMCVCLCVCLSYTHTCPCLVSQI